jgi:hypothetical protein
MGVDPDGFAALLAARLAAIVPAGFHVTLEDDILWFRSDDGRFPGQQGDYHTGSTGIWPQVRGSMLHLWYGTADDVVLACEPIPLSSFSGATSPTKLPDQRSCYR